MKIVDECKQHATLPHDLGNDKGARAVALAIGWYRAPRENPPSLMADWSQLTPPTHTGGYYLFSNMRPNFRGNSERFVYHGFSKVGTGGSSENVPIPCRNLGLATWRWSIWAMALVLAPAAGALADDPATIESPIAAIDPTAALSPIATDDEPPINLIAEEVGYDKAKGLYVARGKVELLRGEKVVMADTMTYNERTKRIIASGHVVIIDENGDIQFANYADVTDDVKEGILQDFRMLLAADRKDAPNGRIAAIRADRIEQNTKEVLTKMVYTPCLPCREDPSRAPVWQVKAERAVRDKRARTVTYTDARIEMFGIPVLYTPYFRHPDFGVDRQSGFLSPEFHFSSESGAQVRIPYYLVLGPDRDMTFSPIMRVGGDIEEDPRAVGVVEYRQRVANGRFSVQASATAEDREADSRRSDQSVLNDRFRGHVEGEGLFDIDDNWRWGFDFKAVTDNDYLRKYHLGSSKPILEDKLYAEGFFGRSYAQARTYAFQSIIDGRQDDRLPFAAPLLDYRFVGEPNDFGAYWGLDANFINLRRPDRRDSLRVAATPYWTLPYISGLGDISRLTLSVPMTFHDVNDVDPSAPENIVDATDEDFDGAVVRALPKLSFDWSYPFIQPNADFTQIVEPMVQLVAAPDWGHTTKIPNEDSRAFELDDVRLLSGDRFAGYDRMDSGSRATYGLNWSAYLPENGQINAFLGQSYQFTHQENDEFRAQTGIENDLTDVVGRLNFDFARIASERTVDPAGTGDPADPSFSTDTGESWDLGYRFRYDVHTGAFERHEASAGFRNAGGGASLSYVFIGAGDDEFEDREQVSGSANVNFSDFWSVGIGSTYDLALDDLLRVSGRLQYLDECLRFGLVSTYTPLNETVEQQGEFSVLLTIDLITLGGFDVPY